MVSHRSGLIQISRRALYMENTVVSRINATLERIQPVESSGLERTHLRQLKLTKPPKSLGRLEEIANRLAAIQSTSSPTIRVILFDIGGVLVEPSGVATMLTWMRNSVSAEELWRMWLTSSCVRAFETGRTSPEEFADQVIVDFRLPVARDRFLEEMTRWSVTLFPGAIELVEQIPPR